MHVLRAMFLVKKIFYWGLVNCIFLCFLAQAQELDSPLSVRGFYTLDVSVAGQDIAMISTSEEVRLLESNKPSLINSVAGVQLGYQLSDNLLLVTQGIAYLNRDEHPRSELRWAYLNYDVGKDYGLRIGKFQTPLLQGTELRSVGFSRLWARPIIQGNGASGYNAYEGVELLKSIPLNQGAWDLQLGYGQAEHGLDLIDNKNIKVAAARYRTRNYWFRTAVVHVDYRMFTRDDRLVSDQASGTLLSFEGELDVNNLTINLGLSSGDVDFAPNDHLRYLSLGYPLGAITPYVYASSKKQTFESFRLTPPVPPPVGRPAARPPQPQGTIREEIIGAGFRWNLSETQAFKLQYESVKLDNQAGVQQQSDANSGNILSLTLEGVF